MLGDVLFAVGKKTCTTLEFYIHRIAVAMVYSSFILSKDRKDPKFTNGVVSVNQRVGSIGTVTM